MVSEIVWGNQDSSKIGITQIDGFQSKPREQISYFTRKAQSFSKRKTGLKERLEIFSVQHNFMEKKKMENSSDEGRANIKKMGLECRFALPIIILKLGQFVAQHREERM